MAKLSDSSNCIGRKRVVGCQFRNDRKPHTKHTGGIRSPLFFCHKLWTDGCDIIVHIWQDHEKKSTSTS
jgi:hypothetical protein